jgi:hypothetical protein
MGEVTDPPVCAALRYGAKASGAALISASGRHRTEIIENP